MVHRRGRRMGIKGITILVIAVVVAVLLAGLPIVIAASGALHTVVQMGAGAQAANSNPPSQMVKLIFIHHSTGENWLADGDGGLGIALRDNNYFVSDSNYGWGLPDADLGGSIGDHTDIGHWYNWFVGSHRDTYLSALYAESGQHSSYSRLPTDPGGENEIIMFKSCFPNSHLGGNPNDPPATGNNPLRGQDAWSEHMTVANAKGIYNDILDYFESRPDKLFIVITAPPLVNTDTDASHAANARAFNNWLVNDWLDGYSHNNVEVFDFYNVLTSNGGNVNTNDLGQETGNNHRWWNGAVRHQQTVGNNFSAYGSGDSHPTVAGNRKATGEFVSLLNFYYNRWQAGQATATATATESLPTFTPTSTPSATSGLPTPTATATTTHTPTATSTTVIPIAVNPIYLPIVTKNHSAPLIQPGDLQYLGAFRLPGGDVRPATFAYGGNAMTYNPNGDPSGSEDGFPGSLFITGHDRMAYGELPDGSQVAEVSIPVAVESDNLNDLNQAGFLQTFHNVAAGFFTDLEEIPRIGMQYLDTPATGAKIHLAWGQHLQPATAVASHAWFDPNLASPQMQGTWFIGNQSLYSVNGYLLVIPAPWADNHTESRYLGTGRFRDGGWSGMGPSLFAYRPWIDSSGIPAQSGTHLDETMLLLYESSENTSKIERNLDGYQHPDEWEGGAWITTGAGMSAVLFAGTKGTGAKYWYGYVNPAGPEYPCVAEAMVGEMTVCRLADGTPCPAEDLTECDGHNNYRGWWSARFDAHLILYDPADLAKVAAGELESWEPQPYAFIDIDEYLFLNPAKVEQDMLGTGVQRRMRISDVAYDPINNLLYALELFADESKPVVHVWRVR